MNKKLETRLNNIIDRLDAIEIKMNELGTDLSKQGIKNECVEMKVDGIDFRVEDLESNMKELLAEKRAKEFEQFISMVDATIDTIGAELKKASKKKTTKKSVKKVGKKNV